MGSNKRFLKLESHVTQGWNLSGNFTQKPRTNESFTLDEYWSKARGKIVGSRGDGRMETRVNNRSVSFTELSWRRGPSTQRPAGEQSREKTRGVETPGRGRRRPAFPKDSPVVSEGKIKDEIFNKRKAS